MQSQTCPTTHSPSEDPERELARLAIDGGPLRRQLARIAGRLVATQAWDRLGFARLGDYGRERVGLSARELQELSHVDGALATLPRLDEALVSGRLSWTKLRLLCRVASASDERAWLLLSEPMSTRELARRVRAVESSARDRVAARSEFDARAERDERDGERRETLRVPCADRVHAKWGNVRRLVRRVAGEWLPFAVCAEYVAAEVISALPLEVEVPDCADREKAIRSDPEARVQVAVPLPGSHAAPSRFVAALAQGLEQADAFELDRRLRRAVALERGVLCRMGPLLVAVADGGLFRSLGLNGLDVYARERLGMSPRKARALLRLERACRRSSPLAEAWRSGALSWSQAQTLVTLVIATGSEPWQAAWIERVGRVSVRRLEDDVEHALAAHNGGSLDPGALPPLPAPIALNNSPAGVQTSAHPRVRAEERYIRICAAPGVARLFRACLATVQLRIERDRGRASSPSEALEVMLDHVLDVWTLGERALSRGQRRAHGVFARDAWRCTVPGCRSYRNLQAHHVRFRSRGGSHVPENLTTLCAAHHQRGVHGGRIRISGRAPERLHFELPLGGWRAGDVRVPAV